MTPEENWAQVERVQKWFLAIMSGKMAANTFKGDWLEVDLDYLYKRLGQELEEYIDASKPAAKIQELGDIANICMMMADKITHEESKKASTQSVPRGTDHFVRQPNGECTPWNIGGKLAPQ